MNFNRIGRIMICLLLVCALLINISPIKAQATGGAALLGVIKGATLVSVPVALWAVAALIAIGVTVDWVTDPNYNSYDALVDDVSTFLTNAGTYVKDGMIDMYRVVDETGKAVYYAAGDAMESVRSWLFDSETVVEGVKYTGKYPDGFRDYYDKAAASPYAFVTYDSTGTPIYIAHSSVEFEQRVNSVNGQVSLWRSDGSNLSYYTCSNNKSHSANVGIGITGMQVVWFGTASPPPLYAEGLALGQVPTVPIDGTGAREWSEEYTNNGLYIVGTGGGGNNNPNDGKWFWPLAFGLTAAELYAMSQADQWAGDTSSEFDQYETKEEFAVSPGAEVEFGQSIELSPSTDSETGGDTGSDTGSDSEIKTDYTTWFQKVVEGITELPQKIANAFKSLLQELFVPDPEFIPNKVEALKAEYKFLDPMLGTGEDLKLFFQNIGSQPPVIWIDLGAGAGWHLMGGKVKFIDLTWYAQYKPTVDPIVGGFIWLWVAWRMFKAVPGLLTGDSGTVGAPVIAPDFTFNQARLPAGRSRRKKEGE